MRDASWRRGWASVGVVDAGKAGYVRMWAKGKPDQVYLWVGVVCVCVQVPYRITGYFPTIRCVGGLSVLYYYKLCYKRHK